MNKCFFGIDTSNYTTSIAAVGEDGRVILDERKLLPVPAGGRGLRQSEALFAHVRHLGTMLPEAAESLRERGCEIAAAGFDMCDMPSSDAVWSAVLRKHGFVRKSIPDQCPNCFTAEDFCDWKVKGTFVLGFGGHVATVVDGVLYDSWDSSKEIPQYFWERKIEK
jgi:hypothetical protein